MQPINDIFYLQVCFSIIGYHIDIKGYPVDNLISIGYIQWTSIMDIHWIYLCMAVARFSQWKGLPPHDCPFCPLWHLHFCLMRVLYLVRIYTSTDFVNLKEPSDHAVSTIKNNISCFIRFATLKWLLLLDFHNVQLVLC